MVKKKQKVRFHKGDKRPNKLDKKLRYKAYQERSLGALKGFKKT